MTTVAKTKLKAERGRLTEFQSTETWDKVEGKTVYGSDLQLPGMLIGKILRSPHPHARIKNIDTGAALALPGVRAVLTGQNVPQKPFGIIDADELPLAKDKVRYIGDEVAAVAAVDEKTAKMALEAIKVEYEVLPAVFEPQEALKAGAPQLHASCPDNLAWERLLQRGDVEKGFAEAGVVVEETFTTRAINHAYMETIACLATYNPYQGLILHTALQSPHIVRDLVAGALGLSPARVQVVGPAMGGGFGGRVFGNLKVYLLSAMLAMHTGYPVKIQLSRQEEFIAGRPMVPTVFKLKMGLSKEGLITARQAEILVDNGAYSAQGPWVAKTVSERNDSLYKIPNISTLTRLAYTNKVPTGQMRAYGNQTANYAFEALLDMAARKLKMDPLALRLKNCIGPGDTSVHGLKIKSCHLKECFEKAATAIGWHNKKPGRGYGISGAVHANGSLVAHDDFLGAAAQARLETDGTVSVFTGEQDYGQGMHTVFAQICARVLKTEPQNITVYSKDTATTPFSQGAFAMRQTTIGGNAVMLAAQDLKQKMIAAACELLNEEVEIKEAMFATPAGKTLSFAELALTMRNRYNGLSLSGTGNYNPARPAFDESGYGDISATYSFAAHAAEVEIDPETGALTVHKIVAVHDSGTIINYTTSLGQVFGGVVQGLGYSCFEGYRFADGRVLNDNFSGYLLPTFMDVPPIEVIFIDKPDPIGPFGAKGLGEIVMVPILGALACAIADAAGAPVTALPMSAENIFRAVSGKECL